MSELKGLANTEDATAWAQKTIKSKNRLTQEDAVRVECAFAAKLAEINESTPPESVTTDFKR